MFLNSTIKKEGKMKENWKSSHVSTLYHTERGKNGQLIVQSCFYTLPYRKREKWTIDSPVMFLHSTIQKEGKMKKNC
jgi:hypothetical protein